MAKWSGAIGYGEPVETEPDVWTVKITERRYRGDLIKNFKKIQTADKLIDNITVANEISIIADPFANQNFHLMLYAEFMGAKWKITTVEEQYPRLIITLGGVYNA